MNSFATDSLAWAAAAFDLYADHGMLKWDAFGTAVRGSGFDPTESQLAEMWAKTMETIADEGRREYITFPEFRKCDVLMSPFVSYRFLCVSPHLCQL